MRPPLEIPHMRRVLPLFVVLSFAFAPAPFPKHERRPRPVVMAGAWDVDWSGSRVRLDLRPDGTARFAYAHDGAVYDGSWKCGKAAHTLTLTLLTDRRPSDYELTFDRVESDA